MNYSSVVFKLYHVEHVLLSTITSFHTCKVWADACLNILSKLVSKISCNWQKYTVTELVNSISLVEGDHKWFTLSPTRGTNWNYPISDKKMGLVFGYKEVQVHVWGFALRSNNCMTGVLSAWSGTSELLSWSALIKWRVHVLHVILRLLSRNQENNNNNNNMY